MLLPFSVLNRIKAQDPFVIVPSYMTYLQENGLSSNECHDIFEDDRNYLWVATDEGLSRFDGREFRHFGVNEGLAHPFVIKLKRMPSGRVIGWTFTGDLFQLKNDEIIQLNTDKSIFQSTRQSNLIIDIIELKDLSLYVATNEARGYVTVSVEGQVQYCENGNFDMIVINFIKLEDQLFCYLSSGIGPSSEILIKKGQFEYSLPRSTILRLNVKPLHSENALHFAIEDYLFRFDGDEVLIKETMVEACNLEIVDEQLWLCGRNRALYAFDTETLKYSGKSILKDYYATGFYKDESGVYWLSTIKNGLIRYQDQTPFTIEHPILEDLNFKDMCSNNEDNLKITGTAPNLYYSDLFDVDLKNTLNINRIDSELYSHLIINYHPQSETYRYAKVHNNELSYHSIDSNFVFEDIGKRRIKTGDRNELSYKDVLKLELYLELGDSILAVKSNEIIIIYNSKIIHLSEQYPALKADFRSMAHYHGGIFLGTKSKGLFFLKNGKLQGLTESDGLLSNHVSAIDVINNDYIILGTNKGLTNIVLDDRDSLRVGRSMNQFSGLKETDILAVAHIPDTLWTVSNNFLQGIPLKLFSQEEKGTQKSFVSSFQINNGLVDLEDNMSLPANTSKLSFQLSKIDFTSQRNVGIYVKLDGFDEEWNETELGVFQYSNLSAGSYTLKIAVNMAQILANQFEEFHFSIKTPIQDKLWFRAMILLIGGVLFYGIFGFVKNKRKNNKERLDQIKRLKMKALMAQINPHFTFNVLNSIQGLILRNDKLEAVEKLSDFSDLVRKLLEVTDRSFVTIEEDLDILKMYIEFEKLRLNKGFTYQIDLDESVLDCAVPPLIIQPLVENSIWHGLRNLEDGNGEIRIIIKDCDDRIFFSVSDNGRASKLTVNNESSKKKRNSVGLELVKERINLINGKYNLTSKFLLEKSNSNTIVSFYLMKTE